MTTKDEKVVLRLDWWNDLLPGSTVTFTMCSRESFSLSRLVLGPRDKVQGLEVEDVAIENWSILIEGERMPLAAETFAEGASPYPFTKTFCPVHGRLRVRVHNPGRVTVSLRPRFEGEEIP